MSGRPRTMVGAWLAVCVAGVVAVAAGAESRRGVFDDELYDDVLDADLCRRQLRSLRAFEFYDASFRIPQGMLQGDWVNLGNYHQCLSIDQDNGDGRVQGKYCMTTWTPLQDTVHAPVLSGNSWNEQVAWSSLNISEFTLKLRKYERIIDKLVASAGAENAMQSVRLQVPVVYLGLCIPKACTVDEVLSADGAASPVAIATQYCRLPDDKPLAGADYVAIVIFSIIGIFTILSTIYDLNHTFILKKDPKDASKLCRCCSIYTNMKRLMTFTKTPGSIDCLDGIRSLSIMWIIMGHVYVNYLLMYAVNLLEFYEWFSKRRAIWLLSADVSVDTFFTMSGLLLVYTAANKMTPTKLLKNLHWFYLTRLLRLFPLLACAVLLQASVFFRVTDGPNWWALSSGVHNCRQYWWTAILHIHNWVYPNNMCLPQTWYVSVDVQLHILSPLLLFWVLRGRRSAWSSLAIGLVAMLVANVVFCFLSNFTNPSDSFRLYYYSNPLVRAPPFIIGMVFGYVLHTVRGRKIHMSLRQLAAGYLVALVASSYAMYQAFPDWDSQTVINLNLSFEKSLWALSICWLIFACVCGYGGPINWFLSLKMWKFVARISYAMYMFHFAIMYIHVGSMTEPFYYSKENIFFTFAGVTAYTVVLAVAASVLVDAPCSTLLKLMMTANSNDSKPRPKTEKLEDGIEVAPEDSVKPKNGSIRHLPPEA